MRTRTRATIAILTGCMLMLSLLGCLSPTPTPVPAAAPPAPPPLPSVSARIPRAAFAASAAAPAAPVPTEQLTLRWIRSPSEPGVGYTLLWRYATNEPYGRFSLDCGTNAAGTITVNRTNVYIVCQARWLPNGATSDLSNEATWAPPQPTVLTIVWPQRSGDLVNWTNYNGPFPVTYTNNTATSATQEAWRFKIEKVTK